MATSERARSRDLFPTDAPVSPGHLIGRAQDVDALVRELGGGVHQFLLGPRRTGKTSVCRAALDALAADSVYVVDVDLFALAGPAELAEAIAAGCVSNRGLLARGARRARHARHALAGLASVTLTSKLQAELGQDIEIAFTQGLAGRDEDRSLEFALRLPQRIAEADGKQLVLFFDEFQEVAHLRRPFGDPDQLTKQMRSIFQDSPRVTVLFTGSVDHLMTDLFVPSHRAFHRFGVTRRLSPISALEWEQGLEALFAQDDVTCAPGALRLLLERSARHPRSTMLIAQQAHLALVTTGTRTLTAGAVEEGFFAALAADAIGHQSEVERIRGMGNHALAVARRIAGGEKPYSGGSRGPVERALAKMLDAGLVERPARGDYHFTDPLLANYVARL